MSRSPQATRQGGSAQSLGIIGDTTEGWNGDDMKSIAGRRGLDGRGIPIAQSRSMDFTGVIAIPISASVPMHVDEDPIA